MEDQTTIPSGNSENGEGKKGVKKKDLTIEKLELSLYRAQLAMIRTATTTTTLGFALYKLLDERIHDGKTRPILEIFTPRRVALILFLAGFIGLVSYSFKHVRALKRIDRFSPAFYTSGVMLVSYIILFLTLMLFIGTLINP
jgi:uncharacterized membrane protein YidH (DUF202 family)